MSNVSNINVSISTPLHPSVSPVIEDADNNQHVQITIAENSYGTFEGASADRPVILELLPRHSRTCYGMFAGTVDKCVSDDTLKILTFSFYVLVSFSGFGAATVNSTYPQDPEANEKANKILFFLLLLITFFGIPTDIIRDAKNYVALEKMPPEQRRDGPKLLCCIPPTNHILIDTTHWTKLAFHIAAIKFMLDSMEPTWHGNFPTIEGFCAFTFWSIFHFAGACCYPSHYV